MSHQLDLGVASQCIRLSISCKYTTPRTAPHRRPLTLFWEEQPLRRYYTCTLLPLVMTLHPAHFLFAKFHADVSPVAGHDGHDQPGGGSHFHYLHHAYFDCTTQHTHTTALAVVAGKPHLHSRVVHAVVWTLRQLRDTHGAT